MNALLALLLAVVAPIDTIDLHHGLSSCQVALTGGRVLSYRIDGEELLWNAEPVQLTANDWAHGGIPLCWPWFGASDRGIHGLAWRQPFRLLSKSETAESSQLRLETVLEGARLEYRVTLTDRLRLEVTVCNLQTNALTFTGGFHPYFRVSERDRTAVSGLDGLSFEDDPSVARPQRGVWRGWVMMTNAVDRIFTVPSGGSICRLVDRGATRSVSVGFENLSAINVWNPGEAKECPGCISGDSWRRFVCVEPMSFGAAQEKRLASGERCSFAMEVSVAADEPATVCYVDAEVGDDSGDGSVSRPFRTPSRARDAIRRLKAEGNFPKGGVAVELAGTFATGSFSLLELDARDSGASPLAPVIWRAGRRGALFTGAVKLSASEFRPAEGEMAKRLRPEVRSRVRMCELGRVEAVSLNELPARFNRWQWPELFIGGKAAPLARYPNRGWLTFEKPVDRGVAPCDPKLGEFEHGVRGGSFIVDDERVAKWKDADDAYLFGFWCWDWYSEYLRIGSIDPATRLVTLAAPSLYGIGHAADWQKSKIRYHALNLPEELDAPGEWYIDRRCRRLYCLPGEEGLEDVALAVVCEPLVKGDGLSNVRFEGIGFRQSLGPAVEMANCDGVVLDALDVNWMTTDAIRLTKSAHCIVRNCRISQIGANGLSVEGGDRRKLVRSGNLIVDNDIGHCGRLVRIGGAALKFYGCGAVVEHNYLHDTPYICVNYGGNEHLFQFNIVECAMLEAGDGGGVYTGRDWGSRGNVLRWNLLNCFGKDGVALRERQGRPSGCEPLTGDIMVEGIYLDDCDSGDEIYGNIFHRAGRAMFTGGGRDNRWHHNLVLNCRSAVYLDTRGLERARPGSGIRNGWDLLGKVEAFHYLEEPWCSRYPALTTVMENEPLLPLGTSYCENIAIGCETFLNCQGLGYGVFRTTLDNRGNVAVGQREKVRDLGDYPQNDAASRARLRFMEDPELVALTAADPLAVQDSERFRRLFPAFPRIPVESFGRRISSASRDRR